MMRLLLALALTVVGCGGASPVAPGVQGGAGTEGGAGTGGTELLDGKAAGSPDHSSDLADAVAEPAPPFQAGNDAAAATDGSTEDASSADSRPADGSSPAGPQPPGYPAGSAPRLEQKSMVGPLSKQTIGFNVYLPPGYDSGTLRYPTVYDLHGLTDNQSADSKWVIPSLESAMKQKLIGPVIVVFPDGLVESYYADSADGKKPSETRIIRDLIPYVDGAYRTIASPQERVVTGFSMGGYGAMELATKFPDIFGAGVAYDAALDTWQTLTARRAHIAQAMFGNSATYFDKYSPWANTTANVATLRASSKLRLVPGNQYRNFDAAFRDHLTGLAIPLSYVETTCAHDYGCLLTNQGAQSWTFIQAALNRM